YMAKKVLGFRYGYRGVSSSAFVPPIELTPEIISEIQHEGGTILGSSRGPQDVADMAETLQKYDVKVLFVIGGDGTFRGAHELAEYIQENNLDISIVGIPKTIDNDIYCSERTFGFSTAVEESQRAICSAHKESRAAWNGIG
ncbi:diphosphate--fructose-6-phosphate 1-phosphotransferase, partial [Candidatus Magnetomorum sp. HK-1]